VRSICKRRQIECGGKLAVHNRLALRADEPEVVTGSADRSRAIGEGGAAGSAEAELSAYRAARRYSGSFSEDLGAGASRTSLVAASRLQFALDLVQEAPVCAIGDDLLRAALDHAQLVQPQRIEA
jgi:hypothetical protein